jgi:hypothetical protein
MDCPKYCPRRCPGGVTGTVTHRSTSFSTQTSTLSDMILTRFVSRPPSSERLLIVFSTAGAERYVFLLRSWMPAAISPCPIQPLSARPPADEIARKSMLRAPL